MIKALVIDEDNIFQNLLSKLLATHGIEIVGRASNLEQVALLFRTTSPDVVLIGFGPEDGDKIKILSKIKRIDPSAKLIVLSLFNPFEYLAHDQEELIDAYIAKGSPAGEMVRVIRRVVARSSMQAADGTSGRQVNRF